MKKVMSCLLVLAVLFSTVLATSLLAEEQAITGTEENSSDTSSMEKNSVEPLLGKETEVQNTQESQTIQSAQENTKVQEEPGADGIIANGVVEGAIDFPDKNLFNALVKDWVDSNSDGSITQTEMKSQTHLDFSYENITDLTGLEFATELQSLSLYDNAELKNINPIKGLTKLSTLDLNYTGVSDVDKLSLINLSDLTCAAGGLVNQGIKPEGLGKNYTVTSSDESIAVVSVDNGYYNRNIRIVAKNPGTATVSLYIGKEKKDFQVTVTDPPEGTIEFPDANLLQALLVDGVDSNSDRSITQTELKNRTYLYLDYENIIDLTGLEYATELQYLDLHNNAELKNINPIKGLTKITTLNLDNTGVSDADKLSLIKLSDLSCVVGGLNYQGINPDGLCDTYTVTSSDESTVAVSVDNSLGKIRLEAGKPGTATVSLYIGTEKRDFKVTVTAAPEGTINFSDKSLLAALLESYGIDKNNDKCITQAELKLQTSLYLTNKNITNLAGLEYATNVTSIYLNDNTGLKNVDVLKSLTNLTTLNLYNTGVTDGDKLSIIQLKNTTLCVGGIGYQTLKPSGLSDKYTVSSSDESIVVASIDNALGKIKLEAKKTGTAIISLYIGTSKKDFQVTVNGQPQGAIVFKDANLFDGLIYDGVDKNADGCITMEEIQAATYLSLSNRNIKDITELGYAKELTTLSLNNNAELSNIDALKKLAKLTAVYLDGTAVSDSDKMSLLKLPDLTGVKGYGQKSIILPGGLAKTYTITSSNSDIVEAAITNSFQGPEIQLLYKAEGTATITIAIGQDTGKTFQVTVGAGSENTIAFEDPKLGLVLMENGVDMNKDNYITADELAKVKILNLSSCGITSLKGLEGATTLINLDLYNNPELSNIEPLRGIVGNLDFLRLSGTQVSMADRMSLLSLNDITLNQGSSFNWQKPGNILDAKTVSFSNSEIATIDTYNTVITGKNPGTTVVTIESDGVKKSFNVTVNPVTAEQPVGEKVTTLPVLYGSDQTALDANGNLWDVGNGESKLIKSGVKEYTNLGDKVPNQPNEPDYINKWGAILDTAGTLWLRDLTTPDKQPVEKVKNVKKTISEYVYTFNDFYSYDSLSFALDNSNSLWMMKVDLQQQEYTKVLDNVLFQDWIFAVDTNHTLWQLYEDKKELLTDVEDFGYYRYRQYFRLYVLKTDHTLWYGGSSKGELKKIASDVDYIIKNKTENNGYVKMDGTYWKYNDDGSSKEASGLNNVQKEMGPFSVKKDGSTWYRDSNQKFIKAINTEIKEYKGSYIVDVDNTVWKLDTKSGTEAVRIGDGFKSFTSTSKYNSDYYTITGFVDGEGIWYDLNGNVQAAENDVMGRSNYFLKGDRVVYYNQIPLLNQVVSISDRGSGQIYATRTDGSIWTLSPNAAPAKIEVAKIMQGDVDGSGKVQAYDALMSLQIATGKKVGTAIEIKAADVGNSGKVEAFDALRILQYATGKITAF